MLTLPVRERGGRAKGEPPEEGREKGGKKRTIKKKRRRKGRKTRLGGVAGTMVAEMVRSPSQASPQKELEGQEAKAEDGQAETKVEAER